MDLFAVPFIKPGGHPGGDSGSPVIQKKELSAGFIKGQAFDPKKGAHKQSDDLSRFVHAAALMRTDKTGRQNRGQT